MADSLRIALVTEPHISRDRLEATLTQMGHDIITRTSDYSLVAGFVSSHQPDVLIAQVDEMENTLINAIDQISHSRPVPVVVFAKTASVHMIESAITAGANAFVVDGLSSSRIKAVVDVALTRFRQEQRLRTELKQAKASLNDRKVIERAKGILMKKQSLDEEAAYKALQKLAMNRNQRLVEVARAVISVSDLLN